MTIKPTPGTEDWWLKAAITKANKILLGVEARAYKGLEIIHSRPDCCVQIIPRQVVDISCQCHILHVIYIFTLGSFT